MEDFSKKIDKQVTVFLSYRSADFKTEQQPLSGELCSPRMLNLLNMLEDPRSSVRLTALQSIQRFEDDINSDVFDRLVKKKQSENVETVRKKYRELISQYKPPFTEVSTPCSTFVTEEKTPPKINYSIDRLQKVFKMVEQMGGRDVHTELIEENNKLIKGPDIDNGKAITEARSAIFHGLIAHWVRQKHEDYGYRFPFAVVAIGSSGRDEMTPGSNIEYAFLFDDTLRGNRFLQHLQLELIHTKDFYHQYGFSVDLTVYNLDNISELTARQLNAFLDMKPIYDPVNLAEHFRERIRETCDQVKHFLHVNSLWQACNEISVWNTENLQKIDLKKHSLWAFLSGIWALCGKGFQHSHDLFGEVDNDEVLQCYYRQLRFRCYLNIYKKEYADLLGFKDLVDFGELGGPGTGEVDRFQRANDLRVSFVASWRHLYSYTRNVFNTKLDEVSKEYQNPTVYFPVHTGSGKSSLLSNVTISYRSEDTRHELLAKSLQENMHSSLNVWFCEREGRLADSLESLSKVPNALHELFPGYAHYETSINPRVIEKSRFNRTAMLRRKLKALDKYIYSSWVSFNELGPGQKKNLCIDGWETTFLDDDHLAAIRLALFTKRLPETDSDIAARNNTSLPLHERFAGGYSRIHIDRYYEDCFGEFGFEQETLDIARFLVSNQKSFVDWCSSFPVDSSAIQWLVELCDYDEAKLRCLYLFSVADQTDFESKFSESARELYKKAVSALTEVKWDNLYDFEKNNCGELDLGILHNFGNEFADGMYRFYGARFVRSLFRLKANPSHPPKVSRIQMGDSNVIGISAFDQPGVTASICGAILSMGLEIEKAHLFSSYKEQLGLNFFHLGDSGFKNYSFKEISSRISKAITQKLFLDEEEGRGLPNIADELSLKKTSSDLYQLKASTQCEDIILIMYNLSLYIYSILKGNIHRVTANEGVHTINISISLNLPNDLDFEAAQNMLNSWEKLHSDSTGSHKDR